MPINELNLGYDISFAVFVKNRQLGSARLNIVDVKAELRNGIDISGIFILAQSTGVL